MSLDIYEMNPTTVKEADEMLQKLNDFQPDELGIPSVLGVGNIPAKIKSLLISRITREREELVLKEKKQQEP